MNRENPHHPHHREIVRELEEIDKSRVKAMREPFVKANRASWMALFGLGIISFTAYEVYQSNASQSTQNIKHGEMVETCTK